MIRSSEQSVPGLDQGAYSVAEVARYTGLPPNTVRSWFKGRSDRRGRGPLFLGDYEPVDRDYAVSFHDLIDTLVVGQFRAHGVTMRSIRSAYRVLNDTLDTAHSFCHRDLYTDGKQIFLLTADSVGDQTLQEVVSRQQFFMHVRDVLVRIDYSPSTKLADRWRISEGVLIDPTLGYGKPVIQHTGVTTRVLADAFRANGEDAGLVADLFQVAEAEVLNAVRFESQHDGRCAA